jgi:dTDP-4-dehydrorhamnose reductase
VSDRIRDLAPGVIINCAAFNNVDAAEDEVGRAFDVNALAVRNLARAAAAAGATLVQYGTDFVFSGETDRPYTEDDQPAPANVYAMSKLAGEWLARDAPRWYVLRVESLFGGPARTSSLDRIIDAILAGRETPVFTDRTISPSYAPDVARATRRLLELDAPVGLYHCVNSGHATWLEIGREAARLLDRDGRLRPVSMGDVPMRARRPKYSAMSNRKLSEAGAVMPHWRDALARHARQLSGEHHGSAQ